MDSMDYIWTLSYSMLGVQVLCFLIVATDTIVAATYIFGLRWFAINAVASVVIIFLAIPWPIIMRIGWGEAARRFWVGFRRTDRPYRIWQAIWLLHAGTILFAATTFISRLGPLAAWRVTVRPEYSARSDWIADVLFPYLLYRRSLYLARATLAYAAFHYCMGHRPPTLEVRVGMIATTLFAISGPLFLYPQ